MLKIRYINHETLYISEKRTNTLDIRREIKLNFDIENFTPLLSHPYVANAAKVSLNYDLQKPSLGYHLKNSLVSS